MQQAARRGREMIERGGYIPGADLLRRDVMESRSSAASIWPRPIAAALMPSSGRRG
jgi:hypothetical protein